MARPRKKSGTSKKHTQPNKWSQNYADSQTVQKTGNNTKSKSLAKKFPYRQKPCSTSNTNAEKKPKKSNSNSNGNYELTPKLCDIQKISLQSSVTIELHVLASCVIGNPSNLSQFQQISHILIHLYFFVIDKFCKRVILNFTDITFYAAHTI